MVSIAVTNFGGAKWIKIDRNMEYVLEGVSRHACYRMYKHDKPNEPGVNAYIKYQWDKTMKVQLVSEGQFVALFTNQRRNRIQTHFLIYLSTSRPKILLCV